MALRAPEARSLPPAGAGSQPRVAVRFPHLDAVRAVAVVFVIATHAAFQTGRYETGPFAGVLARLDFGVTLFFLLSGFLLFRPWVVAQVSDGPAPRLHPYFWHRALRILPAYWIAVVAAMLLMTENDPGSVGTWVRHLTFTQVAGAGHLAHGLTQTWSLSVEVGFYLVLPVLAPWALGRARAWQPRRTLLRLAALEALTIAWLVLVASSDDLRADAATVWLPAHLGWFAAGMALAVVSVQLDVAPATTSRLARVAADAAASVGTCWLVAAGLFVVAVTPLAGPRTLEAATPWEAVAKHVLYGAAAVFLLLPLVLHRDADDVGHRLLAGRPIRWLGEISYGMFLYHLVVLSLVLRWTDHPTFDGHGFLPVFVLTLILTVVVSALSYRLVERPALRQKYRVRG
jgi:peptidoglycan/LPS O-acetylase OafA/YrhL